MRVFIAIDIDEQIRKGLGRLQNEMRSKVDVRKGDVKWVNPDVMHLTLKFLGEIKDVQAVDVCKITKEVASRHESFELEVETVGYFGGRSARVLWVGTGQNCENLLQLQSDLEQELASAGWPAETRKFSGHLTLCYKDFKLGTVSADSISVYQSQLTPKGPVYTVLGNYKLQ
jgi:2'-5' RNA ligase